jgi:hypothetical protein
VSGIRDDIQAAMGRYRESDDDNHFYGAWTGGSASAGGHPATKDRFADFPASQALRKDVNGWPQTKPWAMTDQQLQNGEAPGIVITGSLGSINAAAAHDEGHPGGGAIVGHAGYNTDRNITLGSNVLGTGGRISETPEERNNRLMNLMYHEAGHRTSVAYADVKSVLDQYKVGENHWNVPGLFTVQGNGSITGGSLSEDIADAYADGMLYGSGGYEGGAKAFIDAVMAAAGRNGYPTRGYTAVHGGPMDHRTVSFVPVKESEDGHFYGAWLGGSAGAGGHAAHSPSEAIQRLAAGKDANVARSDLKPTLQASQSHDGAPLDLTKLRVDGNETFGPSLGIPRDEMPQIPATKVNDYLNGLRDDGIAVTSDRIRPQDLKPSQNEVNVAKTAGFLDSLEGHGSGQPMKPVLISADNYVIDGHHQWAASIAHDMSTAADYRVPVLRVDMPAVALLRNADQWAANEGIARKALHESQIAEVDGIILRG